MTMFKNSLTKFWPNLRNDNVQNDNVQKVDKIGNFAKDRGHENFQFLIKFWLNLKLPEIVQINKKTLLRDLQFTHKSEMTMFKR